MDSFYLLSFWIVSDRSISFNIVLVRPVSFPARGIWAGTKDFMICTAFSTSSAWHSTTHTPNKARATGIPSSLPDLGANGAFTLTTATYTICTFI